MKSTKMNFTTTLKENPDCLVEEGTGTKGRAGRKRAIPQEIEPVIRKLRGQGLGYRRTAKILRDDYGLRLHWTRVRDFLKGRSCYKGSEAWE